MTKKSKAASKGFKIPGRRSAKRMAGAAPQDNDPFRHIVLLMLENRSFDHMLGALQSAIPDIDGVPAGTPRSNLDTSGKPVRQLPVAADVVDPDPKHETPNVIYQIDGDNAHFVQDFDQAYHDATAEQIQAVMAYHPLDSLPTLHRLARNFAVCDHWFSSVPGPTWTNRLFAMSGTSLGRVKMPEGIFHPNLHNYNQPSIFRRLKEAGRSFRIYYGDFPLALLLTDCRRPATAFRTVPFASFLQDAAGAEASFPDFAFIEPRYLSPGDDDHPPHPVSAGERLVAEVYDALRANKALWESTLLVVTFDEHGGFYDHAPPPAATPPDGHVDEYTFDRLGVRVPALLISPWIEQQVIHAKCDHTSLLRSLQRKWGLGDMGKRVAAADDILQRIRVAEKAQADVTKPRAARAVKPAVAKARKRARGRQAMTATDHANDNQSAIVAFSAYLETRTQRPAEQKVRAAARSMKSPGDALAVAEERARRYLAQLRNGRRKRG